jgi:hypothetical protein
VEQPDRQEKLKTGGNEIPASVAARFLIERKLPPEKMTAP